MEFAKDSITVDMNIDGFTQIQKTKLFCLLTVDIDINTPKLPSYKRETLVKDKAFNVFSMDDFD